MKSLNRTSIALDGTAAAPYTIDAASNRLVASTNPPITLRYDAAGHAIGDNNFALSYDARGRLATVTTGGQSYRYTHDSAGLRVRKSNGTAAGTTVFVYDQNSQLLGEYDAAGKPIREYVWLDDLPVAVFMPDPANAQNPPLIYFIHADHINTPRVVTERASNAVRWTWWSEPFGTTQAQGNPNNLGAFNLPLRFPGQYFDGESGMHYNVNRDYMPGSGRYAQSDPIGLAGGINTYAYVGANPISRSDFHGLWGSKARELIIDTAFPGLDKNFRDLIKLGSAEVDALINQLPGVGNDYEHGMRAPGQSVADAKRKYCEFVRKNLNEYSSFKDRGVRNRHHAYRALGRALHPIMDSTSPVHRGFQPWHPVDDGAFHGNAHGSMEGVRGLTPELLRETVDLIRRALAGEDCPCGS